MKLLRLFLLTVLTLSVPFGAAPLASADVNAFTVTDFSADYTLTAADKQGELHAVERINVDFTENNHGILRAIPKSYNGTTLKLRVNSVSSSTGAPSSYTTYDQNGNTVLKIGSADQTVTGAQEYTIDYTMQNVVTFYNDHDELYWNVNGVQWLQPFTHVSATVHLPAGASLSRSPVCYAGSYASMGQECTITGAASTISAQTARPLQPGETLSFVIGLQKGLFKPATFWDKVADYWLPATELLALPFLVLIGSFVYWLKRGRDAKEPNTIIPEYAPPDGLSPLEAGTIIDFKVDSKDITATIIDLAVRGYIKIIESVHNGVLGKQLEYQLQLTNDDMSKLNGHEQGIISALFKGKAVNDIISVADSKNKLYTLAQTISKETEKDLTTRGYFRANPLSAGKTLAYIVTGVFLVLYVLVQLLHSASLILLVVGAFASMFIAAIFSHFMSARTAQGVLAKNHILGLKLYMNVAEKDRMEKLQGPNAAYAANAGEPVKTVELFEKLLPYAMVLGVEKQWAKQFETLYTQPPGWYAGNWTAFNVGYLASNLGDSFQSSVGQVFTAPGGSGGSGFGGGGAGGGGGGGGGW